MSRETHIHQARTYLREARLRANIPAQRQFCFVLLNWAACCRLKALISEQAQKDLFA
jgi:hypothetical protein